MRQTARRYWGGLLVVGFLVIPAFDASDTPLGWSPSDTVPFLTVATAQSRAVQTLWSSATIPAISLTPPLPVAGIPGPPPSVPPRARRYAAHRHRSRPRPPRPYLPTPRLSC